VKQSLGSVTTRDRVSEELDTVNEYPESPQLVCAIEKRTPSAGSFFVA
jgi:hypothetical protein